MKGIVAEINGKSAVVLTQTGSFKNVKATSDMIVGKEIDLNHLAGNSSMTRTVMKVTSLAAAGLLVLGVGFGAYCYTLPYSYVHVDINPSIELTVNIYDRIIRAEALNKDGEELLSNNDLRNAKVNTAVTQLLNAAVQQGYLSSTAAQKASVPGQSADIHDKSVDVTGPEIDDTVRSNPDEQDSTGDKPETTPDDNAEGEPKALEISNAVLVTVSSNNTRKSDTLKKELADAVSVELDRDQVKSEILVAKASIDQRNNARAYGVTPGKLVLIEDAMEGKSETDLGKLRKTAIKDLLEMASDKKKDKEKLIEGKQKGAENKSKEKSEVEKAKDKAEADRKKAEAERKKAEAEGKKAEADRKKAEAERKKAEEKKYGPENEHSIYEDARNNWKADIKNDKNDSKNDKKNQANSGDYSNKNGKSQPGGQSNTKEKTDTKDQWNQWNTNRKTRQKLMDEHEKLMEELLEQMNDKLKNQNGKRDQQGNQHGNNMGSANRRPGR